MDPIQEVKLKCPFSGKEYVLAKYIPQSLQSKTSRLATGSKTKFYRVPERYEGISEYPDCGKPDKEVAKAMKQGKADPQRDRKIVERRKEQRLFNDVINQTLANFKKTPCFLVCFASHPNKCTLEERRGG